MKRIPPLSKLLFVSVVVASGAIGLPVRLAHADQGDRMFWRDLVSQMVFVVTGGGRPDPTTKWSDTYDEQNTLAKNSMLADATYRNRVIITDLYYKDYKGFWGDLHTVGHTEQSGTVMLRGYHYDLNTRIPLSIPASTYHTCLGRCELWAQRCASELKVEPYFTKQVEGPPSFRLLNDSLRQCIYKGFRLEVMHLLDTLARTYLGQSEPWAAGDSPGMHIDQSKFTKWADPYNWYLKSTGQPNIDIAIGRAMVIALGTPVSFYSHNPKKPVGYHYDSKREIGDKRCGDQYDVNEMKNVPGPVTCSDFDLKIYWPDLVFDYIQRSTGKLASVLRAQHREAQDKSAWIAELKAALPINTTIVDGGKQHVFKNVKDGKGVYELYPELKRFVADWTYALGREVDIKLEVSLSTPQYLAVPGGPISVFDHANAVGQSIDVDEDTNNASMEVPNVVEINQ